VPVRLFTLLDRGNTDSILELEDKSSTYRLHDRGGAALLAVNGVVEETMFGRIDIGDRPAPDHIRDAVVE